MFNFKFYATRAPYGELLECDYSPAALTAVQSLQANGTYAPLVSRVITSVKTEDNQPVLDAAGKPVYLPNGNPKYEKVKLEKPLHTTVVEFSDGTKSIVKCSSEDEPNVETAIVNALVKRIYGVVDPQTGIADGLGVGTWLRRLASNAFDQEAEAIKAKEAKAKAKEEHAARQAKDMADAHDRRISKLAKEIKNYLEALESLGFDVGTTPKLGQPNEKCTCHSVKESDIHAPKTYPTDLNSQTYSAKAPTYVKPNKPFSQYTQDEKRAYWRNQKASKRS